MKKVIALLILVLLMGCTEKVDSRRIDSIENNLRALDTLLRSHLDESDISSHYFPVSLTSLLPMKPNKDVNERLVKIDQELTRLQKVSLCIPVNPCPGLTIPVPQISEDEKVDQLEEHLHITNTGKFLVNNMEVSKKELSDAFRLIVKTSPEASLIIEADKKVQYSIVLEAITLAQEAGIKNVGFK